MTDTALSQAQAKMRAAGVADAAIEVFTHYVGRLRAGATGVIREDTIAPLLDPPHLSDVTVDRRTAQQALARTAILKLNGGLGTSMGMDRAKSLLPVRDGRTFLDLIVAQVQHVRSSYDVRLPLTFMNSFRTDADTRAALARHEGVEVDGVPLTFLQHQEPKLLTADLSPVSWPADPSLEWCPPGHGDLYTALLTSGTLDRLLDAGYRYANVSNSDNLGAAPSPTIAGWFAGSGAPYAAELCRRTAADRKGGHLAIRTSDHRLILRDTAQTAPEDMDFFTHEHRHPFFHTNNLWFDLEQLAAALAARGPVLGLPLIRNVKTVDPTDPSSPEVVQIETAMGAAIEVFDGATAIVVGRERFLPVKTTNDLLLVRSDAYRLGEDATLRPVVEPAPLVDLDREHYTTVARFDDRFPGGPPSLRDATSLTVRGEWTFEGGVAVVGAATLGPQGAPGTVPAGTTLGPAGPSAQEPSAP
ncbi:UTP--glucose-1-phosphate uridylyltransferase [Cellulomonas sp. S1-8]|uniref:UTP--glucose-1-phosphate uridylyltransferase n=1 Tax=Cellulomonas sp. S1-8 TaxID=2904790 RepID=UPI002243A4E2|nr:UTP--glucose-1-phosphate uridylyltransferase [Cellulomonas sp. S1-8]UZN03295.1 UTP--glucose-1-phosphate uridylyltransferase [Cellulomonas sp. S1-8]